MGKKVNRFLWTTASAVLLLATLKSVTGNCDVTQCGRLPSSGDPCSPGYEEISREPCKTRWGDQGQMAYCCPKNSTESLLSSMYGAELNEFPHMAMLTKGGGFICGATVYNSRYVVTAAHCVVDSTSGYVNHPDHFGIKVGRNIGKTENPLNDYRVVQVIVHEEFKGLRKFARFGKTQAGDYNDIAVLRLDRNIEFGERVKSLQLAPKGLNELKYANKAIIVGWGTTHTFTASDHLQKTNVVIRTDDVCFRNARKPWRLYPNEDPNQLLCVGGHWDGINEPTAGTGDSGGPAVCRGPDGFAVLCGVTSYGGGVGAWNEVDKSCFDNGDEAHCQPSVYAEVDYFRDWIIKNAGEQDPKTFFRKYLYGEPAPFQRKLHQVQISSDKGKSCGGTLIAPDTVVTAAQCVATGDGTGKTYGRIKVKSLNRGEELKVTRTVIHPGFKRFVSKLPGGRYDRSKRMISSYKPWALAQMTLITDHYHQNDLAVLKLEKPFQVREILLPKLPKIDEQPSSPAYELSIQRNSTDGTLRQREFNILDKDECQRRMHRLDRIGYKTDVDENILCGVEKFSGGSTCDRELGGGLICKRRDGSDSLCGIQIYRLCQWSIPNGFLDVRLHSDWIRKAAASMK